MKFKKHNQNGGTYTCIDRDCLSFLDSGNFTNKAILFKKFRPGHRAGVFIWENFHPGYRDLGRKNGDLGNRASPAPHMNTSIFLQRKEWRGEISETEPARLTGLI